MVTMIYVTMTPGGVFGSQFEATDDDAATIEAQRRGYTVLDIVDGDGPDDVDVLVVVQDKMI